VLRSCGAMAPLFFKTLEPGQMTAFERVETMAHSPDPELSTQGDHRVPLLMVKSIARRSKINPDS